MIKHFNSKRHLSKAIASITPTSSVIAQVNAIDLNSRRNIDDSLDTNVKGWGSPKNDKDCNAQRDLILVENVSVLALLPCSST